MKVSVIMPVYNTEKYVAEAIESILNQTFKDFEFIIIDDCSTDWSYQICKEYAKKDKRIRLFRNDKNMGVVKTRNLLFKKVSPESKYIAIIDSDDVAKKDRLEKQVKFMEDNPDYAIIGSNLEIINENWETIGYRKYPETFNEVKKIILKKSPLAQPSALIRKTYLKKVWDYNEKFERAQDYELWVRFFSKWFKLWNIQEALLKYRVFPEQWKSKHLKLTLKNTIKIQVNAIRKYWIKPTISDLIFILAEILLLLLPNKVILFLFKKLEYGRKK